MSTERVRTASDEIAREAGDLTGRIIELLDLGEGDRTAGIINQDMITMVFSLHFSDNDDFAVLHCVEGQLDDVYSYYIEASGAPEGAPIVIDMKKEIDFITSEKPGREEIIENTINRLNWYFQKGSVPSFGVKAPVLPVITDLKSALGGIENALRKNLRNFTYEVLGYDGNEHARAEEADKSEFQFSLKREPEAIEIEEEEMKAEKEAEALEISDSGNEKKGDEDGSLPFVERPYIDIEEQYREAEKEKDERTGEDPSRGAELGMRFHMFWCQFGLPLGACLSGMYVMMSIMNIFKVGPLAIVDLLMNGGWFIFGIPALRGLSRFTKKSWKSNQGLLIYSMGISLMMIVTYLIMIGSQGLALALASHGPRFVVYALILVYYRKRRKYFKY